jgi:aspartyl-tRNA(Asn)/glutamyl-tRNA(Gln) amidotransferase subunit C
VTRIDRETVEKVARLSHIQLTDEELLFYQQQLASVLGYMEQIQTATDLLPEGWRSDLAVAVTPEREDEQRSSTAIDKVLQAAPRVVGTAFQVPRIIE